MNKWIAAHDVWDEDVLTERREMWVNKLQNTWPMPTTSFQPVTGASVDLLDNISLRGENIRSVSVLGEKTTVSTWVEALDVIVDTLFGLYPNMLDTIAHDELLSGFIKNDSTAFRSSIEIGSSELYIATSNNTDTKLNIIRRIATLLNLSSGDIEAEIVVEDDE
ncbi:hypothetical protein IPL85_06305 [Candidatus Saccharibacteria bacterium]|nr:MAG: hypothetical protein IPL85_06305 [Candidatus Saccharibacteria bacterium]